jgi:hypothetical protein
LSAERLGVNPFEAPVIETKGRTRVRTKTLAVSVLVIMSLTFGCIPARADQCSNVRAQIIDRSSPEGCTSLLKVCLAGTVKGNHGLTGTTYFVLDGVAPAPSAATGFKSTTGTFIYTTRLGTLTVRETGSGKFSGHPSSGYGSGVQEVISGTGKFAGLYGILYVSQRDILGTFFSDVRGQLCSGASPAAADLPRKGTGPAH